MRQALGFALLAVLCPLTIVVGYRFVRHDYADRRAHDDVMAQLRAAGVSPRPWARLLAFALCIGIFFGSAWIITHALSLF